MPDVYRNSARGTVATTLIVSLPANKEVGYAALKYYDSADFDNEVTPGAGSSVITLKLATNDKFAAIADDTLTATNPADQVSWTAYATEVKCTPTGITTATHYELIVIARD